jgi:hypothetical protein
MQMFDGMRYATARELVEAVVATLTDLSYVVCGLRSPAWCGTRASQMRRGMSGLADDAALWPQRASPCTVQHHVLWLALRLG